MRRSRLNASKLFDPISTGELPQTWHCCTSRFEGVFASFFSQRQNSPQPFHEGSVTLEEVRF